MSHEKIQSLAVFCGASRGKNPDFSEGAIALGKSLAIAGITLIYGGGKVGLMGEIANATLAEGGQVIGVIPNYLVEKEIAHQELTKLHVVTSIQERKMLINQLADGFIAIPGGIGSMDEFFGILVECQLGFHNKPIGLLNSANYYEFLIKFLDHGANERLIPMPLRNRIIIESLAPELVKKMLAHKEAIFNRWETPEEVI